MKTPTNRRVPRAYRKLVAEAEAAGCTLQFTKKGARLVAPDGQAAAFHFGPSDQHAAKQCYRDLRRMGVLA